MGLSKISSTTILTQGVGLIGIKIKQLNRTDLEQIKKVF
ncbi:MAG: hypothetical protein ACI9U5_001543, partial [Colwellia sp.]